jgi:SAM-dependent methyltransferase
VHASGQKHTTKLLHLIGNDILEIGCGRGESVPYVITKNPKQYVGVDFSKTALEPAQQTYHTSTTTFVQADMNKKMPFPDAVFDEIFSIYGLGWSRDILKTLSEIYRLLKPGGRFTFSWDHYLARCVEEKNGDIILARSYLTPQPTIRYNWNQSGHNIRTFQAPPSVWFNLLRAAGFSISAFEEVGFTTTAPTRHSFSTTYSTTRAALVPFTVIMQGTKLTL